MEVKKTHALSNVPPAAISMLLWLGTATDGPATLGD